MGDIKWGVTKTEIHTTNAQSTTDTRSFPRNYSRKLPSGGGVNLERIRSLTFSVLLFRSIGLSMQFEEISVRQSIQEGELQFMWDKNLHLKRREVKKRGRATSSLDGSFGDGSISNTTLANRAVVVAREGRRGTLLNDGPVSAQKNSHFRVLEKVYDLNVFKKAKKHLSVPPTHRSLYPPPTHTSRQLRSKRVVRILGWQQFLSAVTPGNFNGELTGRYKGQLLSAKPPENSQSSLPPFRD